MKNDDLRLAEKCVSTLRFLSIDAVEKASSGHPGMVMGAAPMAYVLWDRFLKHNPKNPAWPDRDRFVLSGGHASMLLYSLLHLTGYNLPLSELKKFRQLGSKTPGHPECNITSGVEVTTGPLGQGFASAVGLAIAEAHLAAGYNRPGHEIVDHHTYVISSDGDLMEGVSAEAASMAGHLKLGKLIVLYDDNRITLAGSTALHFTESVGGRFEAYGWQVLTVEDGNDMEAIDTALRSARADAGRPSLIRVRTVIGCGAPGKEGTFEAHGAPLGKGEVVGAKKRCGWPLRPRFLIPEDVLRHFRRAVERGRTGEEEWNRSFRSYAGSYPEPAAEFERVFSGELPSGWDEGLPDFYGEKKEIPTRNASEEVLQFLAERLPELLGGSADLNPSARTWLKGYGDFEAPDGPRQEVQGAVGGEWGYAGRNLHFGVREHAMGSIALGLALHGGLIPYTATFFVFSDYMRPPMRLAAMSKRRVIFIFSHDSIGVGEDGPTHQPVEQLMSLRAVPNLTVIRPADATETAPAWRAALLNRSGPTALVFTRQKVPVIDRKTCAPASGVERGGYVLWQSGGDRPELILIGTGSEVQLALRAGEKLAAEGIAVRVVSLPSWELFDRQSPEYRRSVLPPEVTARMAVEAGVRLGWEHYVGSTGAVVGLDSFGASAPGDLLFKKFGFTVENIVAQARALLKK